MLMIAEIPTWLIGVLVALFVVVSAMLILVVLVQRPQGGGLSEAFGSSSGSGNTAFGAKTGDALTTATIAMFVVFLCFAVGLNYAVKPPEAVEPAEIGAAPGATQGATQGAAVPVTTTTAPMPAGSVEVVPNQPTATPAQPAATPAPAPAPAQPATTPTQPQ
jgi:preprotein translocase subunit SecG